MNSFTLLHLSAVEPPLSGPGTSIVQTAQISLVAFIDNDEVWVR